MLFYFICHTANGFKRRAMDHFYDTLIWYSDFIYIYWSDDRLKRSLKYSWNADTTALHRNQTRVLAIYRTSFTKRFLIQQEEEGPATLLFEVTFQWKDHPTTSWSNLLYQVTETVPLPRCLWADADSNGAFSYNTVSLRQLLNYLCLLEANSLGLPCWARPAVIKVMNRADLRKVRRGRTRRHEPDAKYESTKAKAILWILIR